MMATTYKGFTIRQRKGKYVICAKIIVMTFDTLKKAMSYIDTMLGGAA